MLFYVEYINKVYPSISLFLPTRRSLRRYRTIQQRGSWIGHRIVIEKKKKQKERRKKRKRRRGAALSGTVLWCTMREIVGEHNSLSWGSSLPLKAGRIFLDTMAVRVGEIKESTSRCLERLETLKTVENDQDG